MKQTSLKYCMLVSALTTTSALLIALSASCIEQKAEGKQEVVSNEFGGRLIPINQPQIPLKLANRAEVSSQAFLKFFKTPTQQFIPLGFYAMVHDIRDLETLKTLHRRGIILVHRYHSEQTVDRAFKDLESAREAGVGVLQNLPRKYFTTRGREFWQRHISALAGNEQILVWYLPEEAKEKDLGQLKLISDIIRNTDSRKRPIITYVEDWHADYLRRVNSMTDAVVFGAYPSYHGIRPRIEIKRRIDHAYKSGVLVVIAALEALKGKYNWTRPKDVRFDAYLALISGAKGIMWHGYAYAKQQPGLVEAVLDVATELNGPERLGEVILSGKKPRLLNCQAVKGPAYFHDDYKYETGARTSLKLGSIQWTGREYEKYLYIFAVNTAQKLRATEDGGEACRVTVKFGPIQSKSSQIHVISEGRTIDLSGGYFTDTFEPLGTHIYKVRIE